MEQKKLSTKDMAYIGLFACLMAICAWISIPGQIPFTLQTMGVFLAVGLLGGKRGTLAVLVYVLMGAVGLPVFSGFTGGSLTAEGKLRWCPTVLRWDAGGAGCIIWRDLAPGLAYSLTADTGASEDALSDMAALVFKPAQEES